jgi:DNA-binding MarR family transcriptional regulator
MSGGTRPYILDDQVGFLLRRVTQRHLAIFSDAIPEVTTTQFAALAKLHQLGPLSQNHLGRMTAMDAATIKGVVDRLRVQGLIETTSDPDDKRRLTVSLSDRGRSLFERVREAAFAISEATLAPLSDEDQGLLLALLRKLV